MLNLCAMKVNASLLNSLDTTSTVWIITKESGYTSVYTWDIKTWNLKWVLLYTGISLDGQKQNKYSFWKKHSCEWIVTGFLAIENPVILSSFLYNVRFQIQIDVLLTMLMKKDVSSIINRDIFLSNRWLVMMLYNDKKSNNERVVKVHKRKSYNNDW